MISNAHILGDVLLRPIENDNFRVENAFSFRYLKDFEWFEFEVPEGFVSDLASSPFFTRWLIKSTDAPIASVVHDWAYATRKIPQADADKLYGLIAEKYDKMPWYKRTFASIGLWLGGWIVYNT